MWVADTTTYLASARGDLEGLRATLADDVERTEMTGFPFAGTYRTPDGVTAAVMHQLGQDWDNWIAAMPVPATEPTGSVPTTG